MKVLQGPFSEWEAQAAPNAVTVGVYDGVHLGHRMILGRLTGSSHPAAVLTFDPHPAEVLAPGTRPRLITTIEERIELLEGAGVDTVAVVDLAEIRNLQPGEFVEQILINKLGVGMLVVGVDFQFGKDRTGDSEFLIAAGRRHGFDVEIMDLLDVDGVISSSRIRGLIESGEVAAAASLLGSRYRLSNVVIPGDRRGRSLGYPTANMAPPPRKVIPGRGVYAAFARVDSEEHAAAVNVGFRPTFDGAELLIEAYLIDFERDIYGSKLELEFVERLRPELRFDTVEELTAAIREDVTRVRRVIEAAPVAI